MTPEAMWEHYKTVVLAESDELNKDTPISPEWLKEREKMAFIAGMSTGLGIPVEGRKIFAVQLLLFGVDTRAEIVGARLTRGRV